MHKITDLSPQTVWQFFDEITQVPRPSKQEEKIVAYLQSFAQKHRIAFKKDALDNVVMSKPATPGMEHKKTVILQSHVDMVCEKNSTTLHNFATDPIQTRIAEGWVMAQGTTLGADDGIGMAAQLAILASNNLVHGPIECLFTVDEETGLTGAFGLEDGMISGSVLLNLDSEDEGELFIGCAGGIDTIAEFGLEYRPVPEHSIGIRIAATGLKGGHSGDDIHKGLGNANKILARFLRKATDEFDFALSGIDGGNLRNAIAREAFATGAVPSRFKEEIRVIFNLFSADVSDELKSTEPNLRLQMETMELPENVFSATLQERLVFALMACPHGVIEMSRDIPGLVETSTNLASIKMTPDALQITTSQRSSVESAKEYCAQMVESVFVLAGATVMHTDGYPGWTPNVHSEILTVAVPEYEKLFGKKPLVKAIHAGLECGLFVKKKPDLDMISFGPTIRGAHSPEERIEIESVQKFWDYLIALLAAVPEN